MTPERMDLELFGEEGEGGQPRLIGVFERAHGGTLYLDEVADMPRETQSRIPARAGRAALPSRERRGRRAGGRAGDLLHLQGPAHRDSEGRFARICSTG
jgi:hypothetical protein